MREEQKKSGKRPLCRCPGAGNQPRLPSQSPVWFAKEQEKPRCPDVSELEMPQRLISCFNQSSPLKEVTAIIPPLSPEAWSPESHFPAAQNDSTGYSAGNGFHLLSVEAPGASDPPLVCLTGRKPAPSSMLCRSLQWAQGSPQEGEVQKQRQRCV